MGLNVFDFEPAEKATDSDHFANQKAEIWWEVGRMVRDGKAVYPKDLITRQQLSSVKYRIQNSSGKLICEPKDQTKKRIGCSPDRADSWVIGMAHWTYFEPDNQTTDNVGGVPEYTSLGVG
jgi:phage terminase large subunit